MTWSWLWEIKAQLTGLGIYEELKDKGTSCHGRRMDWKKLFVLCAVVKSVTVGEPSSEIKRKLDCSRSSLSLRQDGLYTLSSSPHKNRLFFLFTSTIWSARRAHPRDVQSICGYFLNSSRTIDSFATCSDLVDFITTPWPKCIYNSVVMSYETVLVWMLSLNREYAKIVSGTAQSC